MNKKLLIISPYFPPSNTADMQRVRMSLPYFAENKWDATVITVDEQYSDAVKDELLLQSIPANVRIIKVKASNKGWTSRIGIGSIALRSYSYYKKQVDLLLNSEHFDLIYFSTTQFPVCALGAYWKKKFKIPYVIDMQDPWYTMPTDSKQRQHQSIKQKLMFVLHKRLEQKAMSKVDGLIAVSADYINALKTKYPHLADAPSAVITFGAFKPDIEIASANTSHFQPLFDKENINIVYIGRGGADMHKAIIPVFKAIKQGLDTQPELFTRLRLYFIGTSYAPTGKGIPTIKPLANECGVNDTVIELTDRISYYHALTALQQANALFIPGSDAAHYTASKIYPYLLTQKPLFAIFHEQSSVVDVLKNCTTNANVFSFKNNQSVNPENVLSVLNQWVSGNLMPVELNKNFEQYSAANLTALQVELFNRAINYYKQLA